ncbi:hypothetical protein [Sphingobacterium gobiense]|uniref:Uncharacterized protein n=1 Tax=Sphingobacterium gobiense TaxID=1382456 RepID=A0A2S9JTZ8_9SPHI|nr:hypothetical protein [Sphingobacterium gobiense]PRD56755.1 hypothetical protein C5749_05875 [Sphingobacterium gobiense]
MKKLTILLFFLYQAQNLAAQTVDKREIYWYTYLNSRGLSEEEVLDLALLNCAFKENKQLKADSLIPAYRYFKSVLYEARDQTRLSTLRAINTIGPLTELQSNLFAKMYSTMILQQWGQQEKRLYRSVNEKYTNYIQHDIYLEDLDIPRDELYEICWDLYTENLEYAKTINNFISLEFWPSDPIVPEIVTNLIDPYTLSLLEHISPDGKSTISKDSLNILTLEMVKKYDNEMQMGGISFSRKPEKAEYEAYKEQLEKEREREEKLIKQFSAANNVLAKMIANFNKTDAERFRSVFQNTVKIYDSWSKWKKEYFSITGDDSDESKLKQIVSIVNLGNGVVGASLGIYNAFSQSGKKTSEAYLLEQLEVLGNKIDTLSKEMHERFDIVDSKLNVIFENMNVHFKSMIYQIEEVQYITSQTRIEIVDTRKQLLRMEVDIIGYLQELSKQDWHLKLSYYLDYKTNFPNATIDKNELISTFHLFGYWGTEQAKNSLFSGRPGNYSFQDKDISTEIRKFSQSDANDLNYFVHYTRKRFNKNYYSTSPKSNPNLWVVGASAYLQLATDWPEVYRNNLTPSIVNLLIDNGEELKLTYKNILFLKGKTDTILFRNLVGLHKEKLEALKRSYNDIYLSFLKENRLNSDPAFSIWRIDSLRQYDFKVPSEMDYSDTITLDLDRYNPDGRVREFSRVKIGDGLIWRRFRPDTLNIVKYAHILRLGEPTLSYTYWEGIGTSTKYVGPAIDTDPGKLKFGYKTDLMSGVMTIQGEFGGHVIYKVSRNLGLIYYRSKVKPYAYASGTAKPDGSGIIPYSNYRKNHIELFKEIWTSDNVTKYWDLNVKYDYYDNMKSMHRIRSEVKWEMLRQQSQFYKKIASEEFTDYAVYNALDGAKELLKTYFQLAIPTMLESNESLRSCFYGLDQLLDRERFIAVTDEFCLVTDSIIQLRKTWLGKEHLDSTINRVTTLVDRSALLKKYFSYQISRYTDQDFTFSWTEQLFDTALTDMEQFAVLSKKILQEINDGQISIHYPAVDPLLSKLYHFRFLHHGY